MTTACLTPAPAAPAVDPRAVGPTPRPRRRDPRGASSVPDLTRRLTRRPSGLQCDPGAPDPAAVERDREALRRLQSLAAVVAVACVDAEAGRRPVRDLAAWLAPEAYDKLTRRVALLERTGARPGGSAAPRPLGARVCPVGPQQVEASATVECDGRARAFALRLERRVSRWRVTSVEIG